MKGMDYIGNFKPGFLRTPGFLGNTTGLLGLGRIYQRLKERHCPYYFNRVQPLISIIYQFLRRTLV